MLLFIKCRVVCLLIGSREKSVFISQYLSKRLLPHNPARRPLTLCRWIDGIHDVLIGSECFGLRCTFLPLWPLSHFYLVIASVASWTRSLHFSAWSVLFLAMPSCHQSLYPGAISNRRPGLRSFDKFHMGLLAAHFFPFSRISQWNRNHRRFLHDTGTAMEIGDPRRFFDVNPLQVKAALRGDITPSVGQVELENSTELFFYYFKRLHMYYQSINLRCLTSGKCTHFGLCINTNTEY